MIIKQGRKHEHPSPLYTFKKFFHPDFQDIQPNKPNQPAQTMETNNRVTLNELIVGNDYFQVTRPDLGIEKITITSKSSQHYEYESDRLTKGLKMHVGCHYREFNPKEKLYGIFTNAENAKQMAIKLLIERMSKY